MIKNNILLLIDKTDILESIKNYNVTFLFPIKDLCVGFNNYFDINNLPVPGYILLNRILDNKALELLKNLIINLPESVKGIVFEDIGILNILNENNINLPKILYLNHMNTNYLSINTYLKDVDSVVISTDITIEETKEILNKSLKPLVVYTFGHVNIMYSRRTLLTNYEKYYNKKIGLNVTLEESVSKEKLKVIENEYGTVIYTNKPFNGLELLEENNILFNLINTIYLSSDEIKEILSNPKLASHKYDYKYLSTKKTIYKVKESS